MDEATKQLIEHGVLGAVIVAEGGLIMYLLNRISQLTDRLTGIEQKQAQINSALIKSAQEDSEIPF